MYIKSPKNYQTGLKVSFYQPLPTCYRWEYLSIQTVFTYFWFEPQLEGQSRNCCSSPYKQQLKPGGQTCLSAPINLLLLQRNINSRALTSGKGVVLYCLKELCSSSHISSVVSNTHSLSAKLALLYFLFVETDISSAAIFKSDQLIVPSQHWAKLLKDPWFLLGDLHVQLFQSLWTEFYCCLCLKKLKRSPKVYFFVRHYSI